MNQTLTEINEGLTYWTASVQYWRNACLKTNNMQACKAYRNMLQRAKDRLQVHVTEAELYLMPRKGHSHHA